MTKGVDMSLLGVDKIIQAVSGKLFIISSEIKSGVQGNWLLCHTLTHLAAK